MAHNRRPVHFVYAKEFRDSGSTVMRGRQLAEIARKSLDRTRVRFSPVTASFRNSSLFLTKGALKVMGPERLTQLKARGNVLLFDVVDEVPPPTTAEFADVLVAASLTAFTSYLRDFPGVEVCLVNHHVDPRISSARISPPTDTLRAAYFGELVNAVLTPAITQRVSAVPIDTSRLSNEWTGQVPLYNFHYAVRLTRGLDHFKPFLKGFTAAHANSNLLIQSDQAEAVAWLGNEYPYLLRSEATEANIVTALEEAEESFGSQQWFDGLQTMAEIRERTSEKRIGRELGRALAL